MLLFTYQEFPVTLGSDFSNPESRGDYDGHVGNSSGGIAFSGDDIENHLLHFEML